MTDPEQPVADPERHAGQGSALSPAHRTPFIGREAELDAVRDRLMETRAGRGGGLAIRAESGVGKTRLAHAAAEEAIRLGMTAVFISCRGSLHRPYQPVAALIRTLLKIDDDQTRDAQKSQLTRALKQLGLPGLIPGFAELLTLPTEQDISPLNRRHAAQTLVTHSSDDLSLPDALARLLQGTGTTGQHTLLIFDDLDQAHKTSRSILTTLAGELLRQPALLLATFTPNAPEQLSMAFGKAVLDLPNLTRQEMAALSAALLENKDLSDPSADLLWTHTSGHPLTTILAIESLRSAGNITADKKTGHQVIAEDATIPPVEKLIAEQVEQLPEIRREALAYAAILGDGFRVGALGTLSERAYSDELYEDLEALLKAGWLERSGQERRATYSFTYRLVQQVIYQNIPGDRRVKLHRRAGDYYAIPSTGRRLRTDNALYHYLKIDDAKRGLEVIEMALAQARQSADRKLVMALYRRGARVAASDPKLIDRQIAMAEALGDIYAAAGDYRQAAQAYSDLAPTTSPPLMLAKLGLVLLDVDPRHAAKVLAQVSPAIPRDHAHDLYWRVEAGLVWALAQTGHLYDALRRSRDILGSLGQTAGFGAARTLLRGTLGMALFYYDDPEEAHTHLESARAGWGARGEQDGIMLVNQILIEVPQETITKIWLRFVLHPLVEYALTP